MSVKLFKKRRLGVVAHAYNPSTLGGRGGRIMRSRGEDHPGQHGETPSLLKIQKISWVWWRVPVVPATQEVEAGGLLEPRRWRLQWAKMVPLNSSLVTDQHSVSKNKQTKRKNLLECKESLVLTWLMSHSGTCKTPWPESFARLQTKITKFGKMQENKPFVLYTTYVFWVFFQ